MDNQKRGAAGLEGGEYQIKLILVSSLRATKVYGDNFKLRTEVKDDGKFDDLVLLYRTSNDVQSKEYKRCLQAKHKVNEKNNIALDDLLIDSKKGFNLYGYFKTYIDMTNQPNVTLLKDMILFTNLKFNDNVTEFVDPIQERDYIFHFGDVKTDGSVSAFYRFNLEFREMFKYSKLIKLAEQIILYSQTKKIEMKHNNNTFKDYHNVLAKYVFNVEKQCFHPSFITGDGISDPTTLVLREILLNKCGLNARDFEIILSGDFGLDPSDVWPKGTTLNEEEVEKVESFFNHLIFGVNQPNEEELNTYIHNELKTLYETTEAETDVRAPHFINYVRNWFKEKEISYLSKKEFDQFNECVKQKIAVLNLLNISEMFCEELRALQINFQTINTQQKINSFLCDKDKSIFFMQAIKQYTRLSSIKMLHALQNSAPKRNFVFISLKKDIMRKVMNLISFYEKSTEFTVFAMEVIDVQVLDAIYFQLDKIFEEQKHKKIVIISDEFSLPEEHQANCERCRDETEFDHLSQNTKTSLLEKKISFQGFVIHLKDVFHENDVPEFASPNWWLPLMFDKEIKIGPEMQLSNAYNIKYYIARKPYQMKGIPDDEIAKIRNQDIVVFTQEEYRKQVEENPTKNVHYLIRCPEKDVWLWQETTGEISNIRKNISNSLKANIIEDTKLHIIADDAGMGKSTIISHNAWELKVTDPSLWVIRFNLISFQSELKQFGETKGENAKEFICRELLKFSQHSLEETLFYSRITSKVNPKMIFIFDGFDEVNENCQESVVSIIKKLLKRTNVKRIIVSTRPHLQEKLENIFSQFAINLHPFTDEDKFLFLIKYWSESVKNRNVRLQGAQDENEIQKKNRTFAEQVLVSFSNTISGHFAQFTGVPLQMRMLAEILENDAMNYIRGESTSVRDWSSVSVVNIYEQFIDKKKEIFIKEKSQFTNSNQIIENALKQTVSKIHHLHAELAIMNIMLNSEASVVATDDVNISSMLQFGLVHERNGKLYFIHQTFAEYYFAMLTTAKISLPSYDVKECLNMFSMFSYDFYSNIKLFINDWITIDVAAYNHLKRHFVSIIRHDANHDFSLNVLRTYHRRNLNLKILDLILDCVHGIDEENGSSDIITSLCTSTTNSLFGHENPIILINIIETIKSRYDPKCVRFKDLVSITTQRIQILCWESNNENFDEYLEALKYFNNFLIFVEEHKYLEKDIINEGLEKLEFVSDAYDGCELFLIFLDFVYIKSPVLLEEMLERNKYYICKSSKYLTWLATKTNISSASILNVTTILLYNLMYVNNLFCIPNNNLTTILNHSKAKYSVGKLNSISAPSFTIPFQNSLKRLFSTSPCNDMDGILIEFVVNQFGTQSMIHFLEVENNEISQIEYYCLWSRFERLKFLLEDTNVESIRNKSVEILKTLKQRSSSEVFQQIISERNEYKESILQRACRENDASQMNLISSWINSDEIFETLTSIEDISVFWFGLTLLNLINEKFPNRIENFLTCNRFLFFPCDYFLLPSNTCEFKDYRRDLCNMLLDILEQQMSKDSLFRILSQNDSTFVDFCSEMAENDYYLGGVGRLLKLVEKNKLDNDKIFRLMSQRKFFGRCYDSTIHFIELKENNAPQLRIGRDFMERHLSAEQITKIRKTKWNRTK